MRKFRLPLFLLLCAVAASAHVLPLFLLLPAQTPNLKLSLPDANSCDLGSHINANATALDNYLSGRSVVPALSTLVVNKVFYVDPTSGDPCEQITHDYAIAPPAGAHIIVGPGTGTCAAPVHFSTSAKPVTVECQRGVTPWSPPKNEGNPVGATTLIYTGSGAFFTFITQTHSEISGCTLIGPDGITGSTAKGVVISSYYFRADDNDISGFGNGGIVFGDNSFISDFNRNSIHDNGPGGGQDVIFPAGVADAGENITFNGGVLGGAIEHKMASFNLGCVQVNGGADFHFNHVSLDQCGVTANGKNAHLDWTDSHGETPNGAANSPFMQFGPSCSSCYIAWKGGFILEDTPVSGRTSFFVDNSTVSNVNNELIIDSGTMQPAEIVPQLVLINHGCCDQVSVGSIQNGVGGGRFTAMIGGSPYGFTNLTPAGSIQLGGTGDWISGLPPASSNAGRWYVVHDSSPISAEGQPCVHVTSEAAVALAFSNGVVWKCF